MACAHLNIEAPFEKLGSRNKQVLSFGYNAGKIVREPTSGVRDIRAHLKHDNLCIFIAPARLGCSRRSRRNTPHDDELDLLHKLITSIVSAII